MNLNKINQLTVKEGITVVAIRHHGKASEAYAEVNLKFGNSSVYSTIPYYYRRTGLLIETEEELTKYLISIKEYFTSKSEQEFVTMCREYSAKELKGKKTTKPFFDKLLNLEWNSVKYDLPNNPNWARRIQDIKELGFTLATDTNRLIKGKDEKGTHILLLPIPQGNKTGYETFSSKFKSRAIKLLGARNEYDLAGGNSKRLIPDHKFPEIRWDANTKTENLDDMSEEKVTSKFQLLDNQRNLQKREVCRKCFQTNKRGTLFGLNYFYEGSEDWNSEIPKTGKEAEKGCIGCGWYDIRKWRESINKVLNK
jgi:hypothetical protein